MGTSIKIHIVASVVVTTVVVLAAIVVAFRAARHKTVSHTAERDTQMAPHLTPTNVADLKVGQARMTEMLRVTCTTGTSTWPLSLSSHDVSEESVQKTSDHQTDDRDDEPSRGDSQQQQDRKRYKKTHPQLGTHHSVSHVERYARRLLRGAHADSGERRESEAYHEGENEEGDDTEGIGER